MSKLWRAAAAAVVAAVIAVATAGAASADNSNSNSNTNDVTQFGGFNSGASSGASEKTNWPPTDSSWPPSDVMEGGVGDSGGNKKGNANEGSSSTTPIVGSDGQAAPTSTPTPGTEEAAKPIVPVNTTG